MTKRIIPYGRQFITREDRDAVDLALISDHLTSGPEVTKFEAALCALTGAKHAVACANATAGLHIACLSLGLPEGSLGVTSPITFVASANCFEFSGMRSDFIDIDPRTRCMSPQALEEYCKKVAVPAVVIPVSFTGLSAPLGEIRELSKRFGFKVIEDAAHAVGSSYRYGGQWFQNGGCAHADMSVLSFHPVKTITTGEGGAVLTNDDGLAEQLRLYRAHGIARGPAHTPPDQGAWYYEMIDLGYNYRITDIQCALGYSQLRRIAEIKRRRTEIVERYRSALETVQGLTVPRWDDSHSPCLHLCAIELPGDPRVRKSVYEELLAKGIQTQIHYIPVYWQPYYVKKYGFKKGRCPNAEAYYSRCLSLPLYYGLEDAEVDAVIGALREILSR